MIYWIIGGVVFVILIVIVGKNAQKQRSARSEHLKGLGFDPDAQIGLGKYVHGHPELDKPCEGTIGFLQGGKLVIFNQGTNELAIPTKIAEIEMSKIKNVTIEDATTIEKRVTVGRLLTVGIFAFALKKTEKTELSYLVVSWNDGRFDHDTIFEYAKQGAVENANTARNMLIRSLTVTP